jgi:hypothetical protein
MLRACDLLNRFYLLPSLFRLAQLLSLPGSLTFHSLLLLLLEPARCAIKVIHLYAQAFESK